VINGITFPAQGRQNAGNRIVDGSSVSIPRHPLPLPAHPMLRLLCWPDMFL
jgi:hypothetical protein